MKYKVITPPAAVLTTAELRLHLRLDDDNALEDSMLTALLESAREYAQHYTGRAIGVQTIEIAVDAFPEASIMLQPGPAISITSIKYLDAVGIERTITNTLYALDDYGLRNWALPAAGTTWPATADVANAVKVRYQAGSLPAAVRAALLLLVGHLYEHRENTVQTQINEVPIGVHALLDTVKDWTV